MRRGRPTACTGSSGQADDTGLAGRESFGRMKTWTATTTVDAAPEAVLDVLTDPDAIARWAPLPFDVDDLDTPRLMAGSTARVSGRLAGRRVGFVVEVHEAEHRPPVARRRRPRRPRRRLRPRRHQERLRGPRLRLRPLRQGHHRPPPRGGDQRPAVRRRPHPRHLAPRGRGGVPRLITPLHRKALPC